MLALIVAVAVAGPPDLAEARRHYEHARYDDALRLLGRDCEQASSPADCERLRAFVHAALGDDGEARAAFARMLTRDPFGRLDDDTAPKLRNLFREVQRSLEALGAVSIEPLRPRAPDVPWALRIVPPAGAAVGAIDVYLDASGQGFERLSFLPAGDAWAFAYGPPAVSTPKPRYFVEVTMAGGARISSGTSAAPRHLAIDLGEQLPAPAPVAAPLAPSPAPRADGATADPGATEVVVGTRATGLAPAPRPSGMPRWGIWAIAGGATAALAAGVAAALLLDDHPGAGRIVVGIRIEE